MKEHCQYNNDLKGLTVKYPWTVDPSTLVDNSAAALACQKKMEERQLKAGTHSDYCAQFQDMVSRGVLSVMSEEEQRTWCGPVNCITHHEVLKESATTPVRLVSNSSFANGSTSLNNCLAKGPNTLSDLFENLVKFRGYEIGLCGDVTKAYNSLHTGLIERHTRRLWMRFSTTADWVLYAMDRVQFGDKPAASLMTISVEKASEQHSVLSKSGRWDSAELYKDAMKLLKDTYVDDLTSGGSLSDVQRMMGSKNSNGQFNGTIPALLGNVGLNLKTMVASGSEDLQAQEKLSGSVLGYKWDAGSDIMGAKLTYNISRKRKGLRLKPNLLLEDMEQFRISSHNRRGLLGICNSIYDPLGICSPYTIKLKLLMKDTLAESSQTDWDSPVPQHLVEGWSQAVEEGITQDLLQFCRATRPPLAVKLPKLVGFFDGSTQAFSAVIYVVWMVYKEDPGNLSSTLLASDPEDLSFNPELHQFVSGIAAAKARVTPLRAGLTVPRSEMSSLVLCRRLQYKIAKVLPDLPATIHSIGDSTCVISSMDALSTSLNPFMHSRMSEVHHLGRRLEELTTLEPAQHVVSKHNIADLATRRDGRLSDIGPGSLWQAGPAWLQSARHLWPTTREFAKELFPEAERKHPIRILLHKTKSTMTRCPLVISAIDQCRTYTEALDRVTQNLLDISKTALGRLLYTSPLSGTEAGARARSLLLEDAMGLTDQLFSDGQLDNISARTVAGLNRTLHVTQGRLSTTALAAVTGQEELPVISAHSPLAELIVRGAHMGEHGTNHKGDRDCLARTREVAYLHKPMWLIKKISTSCTFCQLKKRIPASQLIGKIPVDKVLPSPPFTLVSIDLCGHFWVKPTNRSRSSVKVWILIYLCDVSKALHCELVEDYSGPGLVNALRTVFSLRNTPSKISSDPGRNMVRAKSLISGVSSLSNEDHLELMENWPTINWTVHPTAAPWRNGGPEALVKQVKGSLKNLPTSHLSLTEFRTVVAEITASINNRPLGACPLSNQPLTPNQLLLGRNYSRLAPTLLQPVDTSVTGLAPYLIAVYQAWWDRWKIHVLPYLFTCSNPSLRKEQPNLEVGQICLLLSVFGKGSHRTYKYCKILTTNPGKQDGLVRRVTIQYYNLPSCKGKVAEVDVRRLVPLPMLNVFENMDNTSQEDRT